MKFSLRILLAIIFLTLISVPAESQFWSSSRLLLPYFEVELDNAETTTLFAVTNTADEAVSIRASIYSNWGIKVLDTSFALEAHEVTTVDLYRWLAEGQLPDRTLSYAELEHVRAAYCGESSPMDGLFYSEEVAPQLAVGYVLFQVLGGPIGHDVLMGDFFLVTPGEDYAQGQAMLNLDPTSECDKVCFRHGLRFLAGGFDAGTEIFVWTLVHGQPSESAYYPEGARVQAYIRVYDQDGNHIDTRWLDLLPVQFLKVSDLDLPEEFGWFDIRTDALSFLTVRYSALDRYSVGLKTFCLPDSCDGASIHLEKLTNGVNADSPRGPVIPIGAAVHWDYVVTNTGEVPLTNVVVADSRGVAVTCPDTELAPGASMTCYADGIAQACQYSNVGTVTANADAADGCPAQVVRDTDPSHYYGNPGTPSIDLEKETLDGNGIWHDADLPPGPEIAAGAPVEWRYVVENTGNLPLQGIVVTDSQGVVVTCLDNSLAPGGKMTCTGSGFAPGSGPFQYENMGSVTASAACGQTVSDDDPSHYHVLPPDDRDCPFGEVFVVQPQDSGYELFDEAALTLPNPVAICSLPMEVNNLGYRMIDEHGRPVDKLYGVHLTASGNEGLVQIDLETCNVTLLQITGLDPEVRYEAGDISRDGKSMYINCAGLPDEFYRVDLTASNLYAVKQTVIGNSGTMGRVNDWAIHPTNPNLLYGGDRDEGQVAKLEWQESLGKWVRTDYDLPELPEDTSLSSDYAYGGALFDDQGRLILHRNNGETYWIDVSGPGAPSIVAKDLTACAAPRNDAAYCLPR